MPDDLGAYLNEIGRIPLLADASQLHLGRLIQAWQRHPDGPDNAPAAVRRAGLRARERFISANLRLVIPLARKYRHPYERRGGTMMDLIQEGNIGLARGVEKFDPELGYRAATYLYWWIRQAMTRACETEGLIRITTSASAIQARVQRTMRELGPGATLEDACEVLGVDPVKTAQTIAQVDCARCVSLDQQMRGDEDGDGSSIGSFIADPVNDPELLLQRLDLEQQVAEMKARHGDEMALLELHYLDGAKTGELAVMEGCSRTAMDRRLAQARELVAA